MRFKTHQEFFDFTSGHRISPTDVTEEERYKHIKARLADELSSTILTSLKEAGFELTKGNTYEAESKETRGSV